MVLQDTHLFSGTLMDNIRYGNLDASDDEVVEAAKMARMDHYIRTLPVDMTWKSVRQRRISPRTKAIDNNCSSST